ncbi:MAG TPA: lytic murein transglycosylase [Pilimelia sp.]|nr:lytic murein transglycosylase [Pilimelia sp.]
MVDGDETPTAEPPPLRHATPEPDAGGGPQADAADRPGPDGDGGTTAAAPRAVVDTDLPAAGQAAAPPATDQAAAPRRRRIRFAHARWAARASGGALRAARASGGAMGRFRPSRQGVRRAAHRVAAWSRQPRGRVAVPAIVLLALVATAGVAGAYLVPATATRSPAQPAGATPAASDLPGATGTPDITPSLGATLDVTPLPGAVGRPADVLIDWADQMSARVGIPPIAMQAYGYAELVLAQTTPGCQLKWTTLAAIGKVESNHGRANNASLLADGRALPPVVGLPLDGQGGRATIRDTDRGTLDGDALWDRAVGPMQFIPGTWNGHAIDADNDGMRDVNDIDDAALAAANYLCRGGRNMAVVGDWWAAILTYNDVQPYARAVYDAANDYGTRSRT